MNRITVDQVQYLALGLAQEFMKWNEPIPGFETRYPGRLESCLYTPFQTFAGRELYPGLTAKAALLFYLMIKNHPFENGNKRLAVTTLLVFLYLNGKWLSATNEEVYEFAVMVAESKAIYKDSYLGIIKKFLNTYMVNRLQKPTS